MSSPESPLEPGQQKRRGGWPRHISAADDDEGHIRRMTSRGTIAVLALLIVFVYMIHNVLLPFVVGGAVAYATSPAIDYFARRTHLPRLLWAVIGFLVIFLAACGLGYFAIPSFVNETVHIITDLEGILTNALSNLFGNQKVNFFGQPMDPHQMAATAVTAIRNWVTQAGTALLLAGWSFSAAFGMILTLVILFYFMVGGPTLGAGLFSLVPPHQRPLVDRMWERVDPVLKRYFIGIAIVVVYAMVASYIGLGLVLGLNHAVLLAILTGLLEMIPVVGPAASAIVAGLVALHHAKGMWAILAYVLYAGLLRLSIDEFLGPIVLGRAAHIPAVMVIFCFLAGGVLFGITGVIMAVPVALTIKIVLATLYDEATSLAADKGNPAEEAS